MLQKLLLFDIDGTLLLAEGVGKIALEEAFEAIFGISGCWKDLDPHGRTDAAIFDEIALREIGRLLSADEFDTLMRRYELLFGKYINQAVRFRLMPGVIPLLEHLSAREDIFLALATGNFEGAGRMKLARGGIERYFRAGGFGMDSRERRKILMAGIAHSEKVAGRKFERSRTFVIGDTEYDIAAANAAGLRSIAVLTNGRSREHFSQNRPDHILKDLTDIPAFLACLK
jgi:phosphoglycolate phosphatase-like HAD superfamily hydrolase